MWQPSSVEGPGRPLEAESEPGQVSDLEPTPGYMLGAWITPDKNCVKLISLVSQPDLVWKQVENYY